jgi:hypothetical protein
LCSGFSPSLSASGSMNGADMRAPPGMLRNPKRAGIVARSTLPGSTVLSPSMNRTMSPVSFNA